MQVKKQSNDGNKREEKSHNKRCCSHNFTSFNRGDITDLIFHLIRTFKVVIASNARSLIVNISCQIK